MAGYNFMSGGYIDDRNKATYGENGYSDHVCRPVLIDAEGRKRPIIAYSPNHGSENYVTEHTERIVEHVRAPVVVNEYNYTSQAQAEPLMDYGVAGQKWSRAPVTEYRYGSPTKVEPMKDSRVTSDNWHDRPPKVEDFFTKVQTEANRPTRPGFLSATNWRNPPNSVGQGRTTDPREYSNNYNNDWNKPNGYSLQKGGWERPSHKGWASPPPQPTTPLSGPTNDVGKAVEILTEAVKSSYVTPAPPQKRFTVPKRDSYAEIIDSTEAARRYGNLNLSSRPFQTGETYIGTIDSREAERKYNGARLT